MPLPTELPQFPEILDDPKFTLHATSYVKNAALYMLRKSFSTRFVPKAYRLEGVATESIVPGATIEPAPLNSARQGARRSGVSIYDAWPEREAIRPAMVLETGDAEVGPTTLDDEAWVEVEDSEGNRKGLILTGVFWFPLMVHVEAESERDRDAILDLCSMLFRFIFRDKFRSVDISYLDIKTQKNTEEKRQGIIIFPGTLTIQCQSMFTCFLDYELFQIINSLDLQNMKFSVGS